MRPWLGLGVLAAIGCGTDDGAILTFEAPEGMPEGMRVQIVLASADPETIGAGVRQRVRPGGLGEEDVVYYRQRARGGVVADVASLDGFTVRIEPELAAAPDEQFIPFALVFDDGGELAAVGTVQDPDGNPLPVIIREGARSEYTLTLTTTRYPGPDVALAANEGLVVGCLADEAVWTSGIAWRPAAGPQLRLLLADRSADPDNADATARAADLDCDSFDAADSDCDDLRSAYHPGQAESCDGLDTDCDGQRMEIQECALSDACGGTGVSLCVDQGTNAIGTACQPNPACACISAPGNSCARCIIDTRGGAAGSAARAACAPSVGKLHFTCESQDCLVEVVDVDGPFEATLGVLPVGPFTPRVMGAAGQVYVRTKYEGGGFPAPSADLVSVGTLYLAVTNPAMQRTFALNVDLEISEELADECSPAEAPDNYAMYCAP